MILELMYYLLYFKSRISFTPRFLNYLKSEAVVHLKYIHSKIRGGGFNLFMQKDPLYKQKLIPAAAHNLH